MNVWLQAGKMLYEVDCLWRAQRLIVELDGRAAHDTARAFERDREKDRRLRVARWNPIRITWRKLEREQPELAADLANPLS
jgi:very-short-patch-repair endonuclease